MASNYVRLFTRPNFYGPRNYAQIIRRLKTDVTSEARRDGEKEVKQEEGESTSRGKRETLKKVVEDAKDVGSKMGNILHPDRHKARRIAKRSLKVYEDQVDLMKRLIHKEQESVTRNIKLIATYQEEIGFLKCMMEIHKKFPESLSLSVRKDSDSD